MSHKIIRYDLIERLRNLHHEDFEQTALDIFHYQAVCNPVYAQFIDYLNLDPYKVNTIQQIPFLPIQLFKTHKIQSDQWTEACIFSSSGTSGSINSKHYVRDLEWYKDCALNSFEQIYGNLKDYILLALLPKYLERKGSSLVYMAKYFIDQTMHPVSNFFLNDLDRLRTILMDRKKYDRKIILLGVSFALMDLAAKGQLDLNDVLIMETGGMKGERPEMTKEALHLSLKNAFNVENIHAEYGMTELLSQAYSSSDGIFTTSPLMKVMIRELNDPFHFLPINKTGGVNVIDLANLDSCAFIATDDLGCQIDANKFRILGRIDHSDIRGCNLMYPT